MRYRVGNTFYDDKWNNGLYHHGIPGMSWHKRRFQNLDGSYTELGKRRYGIGDGQPNFGRNIQEEMRSRTIGGASKPVTTIKRNPYYTQRFESTKPANAKLLTPEKKGSTSSVDAHFQQRKAAQQKQYENSPRGKAEAFLNKVGQGAQQVKQNIKTASGLQAREDLNKQKKIVQDTKDQINRDRAQDRAMARTEPQLSAKSIDAILANKGKTYNGNDTFFNKDDPKGFAKDYYVDRPDMLHDRQVKNWENEDRLNLAKYWDQVTPLSKVENFANQVGQGAQQLGQNFANAVNSLNINPQQIGQAMGQGLNNIHQTLQNAPTNIDQIARQLGGQIDRGLNLGVETGRILDAARQNREGAMGNFNQALDQYRTASAYDPNMNSVAGQMMRQNYQDAVSQLAGATRSVEAWEQQYGNTVIGGVRNAINQGQQILSNLLSRLFGRG